jgi:quinone-modifying oxidoreductase subunit QmoC
MIHPDLEFKRKILGLGAHDLTACYQCGTCSVVCPLSTADNPFPRKEMIWAQWGLKEKLASDLDIWLCHSCNECSRSCPRDAKPGDLMAATRNYFMVDFMLPRFLGKSFSPLTYFLFVIGIFLFIRWLPMGSLQSAFFIVAGLVFLVTVAGLRRFWKRLNGSENPRPASGSRSGGNPKPMSGNERGFVASVDLAVTETLKHSNFNKCTVNTGNHLAHLLIFYGFASLFVTCVGAQIYALTGAGLPLPLTNPIKILGMIGGLALLSGLTLVIYRRLFRKAETGKASYFDWFFIVSLYVLTITGLALPLLRLVKATAWVHSVYLWHLVFLFLLVACFPLSKFMHPFYRILAMIYAKQIGRDPGYHVPGKSNAA